MADLADLNPDFRARLDPFLAGLAKAGIPAHVISGYRSPELQAKLYADYQARLAGKPLPYPEGQGGIAAQPWSSFHNYGLAADVLPNNPADYPRMWAMAPQYGLTALAQKDKPHFQMAGDLPALIEQYHLAGWRPQSQPAPGQGAIAYSGPSHVVMPDVARASSDSPPPSVAAAPWRNPTGVDLPMGMGNNNPANIKFYSGPSFAGVVGPSKNTDQGDPQFVFESPQAGMNAAYQLLSRKYAAGMTTPAAIIAGERGWTPGNMQAAANIAKSAGIGVNDDIGFNDPAKAQKFLSALIRQEQGKASSYYPDTLYANAIKSGATPTPAAPDASLPYGHPARPYTPTPGTTLTSTTPTAGQAPTAGGGTILPGFGSAQASNQFISGLDTLDKGLGGPGVGQQGQQAQQQGQQQKPPEPSPMIPGPGARNVSQLMALAPQMASRLTGYDPFVYGTHLSGMGTPVAWSGAPIGQGQPIVSAGVGAQAAPTTPYGTSLASLQQLQMLGQSGGMMDPTAYGTSLGGGYYG